VRVHPHQRALAAATATLLAALVAQAADPPGTPRSNEALGVCSRARAARDADEKNRLAARGLALAEQAVAEDEHDPKAHFAVFCTLGTEMKQRGVGIRSLVDVRRLRREIDRTLELAPGWPDALVGKGSFLIELPGMLGGDPREGERLLREALRIDPDFLTARLNLAHALADRGAREEASEETNRAVALAERKGDREAAEDARALLTRLDAR
jgi:tetratricopeptide (TPR) repeat protein